MQCVLSSRLSRYTRGFDFPGAFAEAFKAAGFLAKDEREDVDFAMGGSFLRIRPIAEPAPPKAPRSGGAHVLPIVSAFMNHSNASCAAEVEGIRQ